MGGINIGVAALLMLLAFATLVNGENKTWPDFSCHPARLGSEQSKHDFHTMQKNQCADDEKREGSCAKICYLKWNFLLHQPAGANDPAVLEPEAFASELADVNNIDYYSQSVQGLLLKMEKCKKDHPEIAGMWKRMRSPCKVWEPILNCIDKAIGC